MTPHVAPRRPQTAPGASLTSHPSKLFSMDSNMLSARSPRPNRPRALTLLMSVAYGVDWTPRKPSSRGSTNRGQASHPRATTTILQAGNIPDSSSSVSSSSASVHHGDEEDIQMVSRGRGAAAIAVNLRIPERAPARLPSPVPVLHSSAFLSAALSEGREDTEVGIGW